MKGYGLLILLTALCLLLLPLPAFPFQSTAAAAPPKQQDSTSLDKSDATDEKNANQATFRILCDKQVVELDERDFLIRTLAFEMSPTYHTEALKAQTVAAYTYYGRRREAQRANPDAALLGADFATPDASFPAEYTAEKLKARWGSAYTEHYNKLCKVVDAVLGETIRRDGQLIDACYFAISNGCTESAKTVWGTDIPYLQSVASPGDKLSPDYETKVTCSDEQIKNALAGEQNVTLPADATTWFGEPTLSAAGTVASIPVGNSNLPGTKVRALFGLRSASFTVTRQKDGWLFTVHGYGHGVGMSQYGADYLARQGYTYKEILCYYYTGVVIE
ncbi:MAG: stage II sporulation protein D [Clostridia bacterium]|nr:stage II sporulation protein D [Clostridia bacterium]